MLPGGGPHSSEREIFTPKLSIPLPSTVAKQTMSPIKLTFQTYSTHYNMQSKSMEKQSKAKTLIILEKESTLQS